MANLGNLSSEINEALRAYNSEVRDELEIAQKKVSKDLVKRLKIGSPDLTGDYRKGWRMKKTDKGFIIHNKTDYQLTHLLEKGHAKVNGGRVPAKVHIRPEEEKAIRDYLELVEQAIRG